MALSRQVILQLTERPDGEQQLLPIEPGSDVCMWLIINYDAQLHEQSSLDGLSLLLALLMCRRLPP